MAEDDNREDEKLARRSAELEFVAAAYDQETEAWHDTNASGEPVVHRLISLEEDLKIQLSLTMPPSYPIGDESLKVSAHIHDETSGSASLRKVALNALPDLASVCQRTANEGIGDEAVFSVLSRAEEWSSQGEWSAIIAGQQAIDDLKSGSNDEHSPTQNKAYLGRRLIYSHHIISKVKRGDIKALASDLDLTGFMRVGWPGLLIIEGREEDYIEFYDTIRRWNWQYLVVRGEQQENIVTSKPGPEAMQTYRRFQDFQEVEDMSVVAKHCRDVGLEALFRTSMKVYDDDGETQVSSKTGEILYGALVMVDHMNDGKGYRKWLRKTAKETTCKLLLKQYYPSDDYSKKARIIVGVLGAQEDVSEFLKRWRTSRVDVDSRGKACLERMMSILIECELPKFSYEFSESNSTDMAAENLVTTTQTCVRELLFRVGGPDWAEVFDSC